MALAAVALELDMPPELNGAIAQALAALKVHREHRGPHRTAPQAAQETAKTERCARSKSPDKRSMAR